MYSQDVYQYLLFLTHDPTLSADLLQETFLKAIYSLHKFRGDSSVNWHSWSIYCFLYMAVRTSNYRKRVSFSNIHLSNVF
ncbi:sigma factor [Bacillus salinus]|uniref:sigma factor n=1 Tax=Bacillus sp. HMF5848 TaxID=2495421 RepID=UPI0037C1B3DD